jgi:hypothetical protein
MKMIGHHHPFVQFYFIADFGGFQPFIRNNFPSVIQQHLIVNDIPEQTQPVLGANRNEIRTGLGIIVSAQSD